MPYINIKVFYEPKLENYPDRVKTVSDALRFDTENVTNNHLDALDVISFGESVEITVVDDQDDHTNSTDRNAA